MCGIVGVFQFGIGRSLPRPEDVARMRDRMAHRGFDGVGLWTSQNGRVVLGHRRLAIIDLSASGEQPMADASGHLWLSFNGEIYNHRQLRAELESLGHQFRSDHADSEVILCAYRQWGLDAVQRLRGMFAFSLWDEEAQRLWLVRDRSGIKPLYYHISGGRITFASEIKGLLTDPGIHAALDEESLFHYLSFLTVPAPKTLFNGIRKLPNATMLIVHSDGRMVERRYWDPIASGGPGVADDDTSIVNELRERLADSVCLHTVSDVPVGVFLSGGVDSSAVAALCARQQVDPVRAFTVRYDGEYGSYPSEIEFAREAARSSALDLVEVNISYRDMLDALPRIIELQDEPIADPVCIPLYYLAKAAREHGVPVCQVGEGADELFFGYSNWRRSLCLQELSDIFPKFSSFKRPALQLLRQIGKGSSQPYDWLQRSARGQPIFWGGAEAYTEAAKREILSPRLRQDYADRSSWEAIEPIRRRYLDVAVKPSRMQWMTYLDLNFRLPELLLMRVDKMTMGHTLEARVPFLDHELVQFALQIPDAAKIRGGQLKSVLKQAVRGLVPDRIIDRPKQGFGLPLHEWLSAGPPEDLLAVLDSFIDATDTLDRSAVKAIFASGARSSLGWPLLNLALWWNAFVRTPTA